MSLQGTVILTIEIRENHLPSNSWVTEGCPSTQKTDLWWFLGLRKQLLTLLTFEHLSVCLQRNVPAYCLSAHRLLEGLAMVYKPCVWSTSHRMASQYLIIRETTMFLLTYMPIVIPMNHRFIHTTVPLVEARVKVEVIKQAMFYVLHLAC